MDQNEQKSVWLKLLLPICLGIFAAAIYQNAIKAQKDSIQGYVALKNIEPGTTIGTEEHWNKLFGPTTLVLHAETPDSIKSTYDIDVVNETIREAAFPFVVRGELAKGDMISKTNIKN